MENNQRLITYVNKEVKEGLESIANKMGISVSSYLRIKIIELLIKEGEQYEFYCLCVYCGNFDIPSMFRY